MPDTLQTLLPTDPELLDESAAKALLDSVYAKPMATAVAKDIGCIDPHLRHFISLSPFCAMATSDGEGRMDVTPRGDKPGFVKVLDEKTLAVPDRPGNNRLDSLHNIVRHPGIGLLFLIPGFDETARINGTARLSVDPRLLDAMSAEGKPPRSVLVIKVHEAYLHCAKAFRRSRLWDPTAHVARSTMPSLTAMILDQLALPKDDLADREAKLEDAYKRSMW